MGYSGSINDVIVRIRFDIVTYELDEKFLAPSQISHDSPFLCSIDPLPCPMESNCCAKFSRCNHNFHLNRLTAEGSNSRSVVNLIVR